MSSDSGQIKTPASALLFLYGKPVMTFGTKPSSLCVVGDFLLGLSAVIEISSFFFVN
jgi:hypothetical protein